MRSRLAPLDREELKRPEARRHTAHPFEKRAEDSQRNDRARCVERSTDRDVAKLPAEGNQGRGGEKARPGPRWAAKLTSLPQPPGAAGVECPDNDETAKAGHPGQLGEHGGLKGSLQ